jgi:hypothetical protein
VAQVVDHLPSKHKAEFNPQYHKMNNQKEKKKKKKNKTKKPSNIKINLNFSHSD